MASVDLSLLASIGESIGTDDIVEDVKGAEEAVAVVSTDQAAKPEPEGLDKELPSEAGFNTEFRVPKEARGFFSGIDPFSKEEQLKR
jgi:hypothetical protein